MEAKHTPGPWFRLTGGVVSNTVGADWPNERHFVAKIDCQNEANAALIAAAPDLLAACKAAELAIAYRMTNERGLLTGPETDALHLARAAIAKAHE